MEAHDKYSDPSTWAKSEPGTWHCDTCGEEAMYRANGVCYCDYHWEDYLFEN